MVRIQLRDEIIAIIAVMVIKIGKVAFLAAGAPRPCFLVIVLDAFAGGDLNSVPGAPFKGFLVGVFVRQPCVMRHILRQHRLQRDPHHIERL